MRISAEDPDKRYIRELLSEIHLYREMLTQLGYAPNSEPFRQLQYHVGASALSAELSNLPDQLDQLPPEVLEMIKSDKTQ